MALLNPNDPNSSIDLLLQQEQLAKRKAVADQLVARAGDAEPMTHWAQALAQGVRGITAGLEKRDATEAQMNIAKLLSEGQMAGNAALLKAQGGYDPVSSAQSGVPIDATPLVKAQTNVPAIPDHGGEIFNGLTKRGLSPVAAAGVMGNIGGESNFDPGIGGDPDKAGNNTSFGLAQWRGPRFQALQQYAASQGKDWRDRDIQLDHLTNELKGPEARAFASLNAAKTPQEAATVFMRDFERPAAWAMARSGPKREAYAAQALTRFGRPQQPVQVASADPSFVPGATGADPNQPGSAVGDIATLLARKGQTAPSPEYPQSVKSIAQVLTRPAPAAGPPRGGLSPDELQGVMADRRIPQAMKLEILKANRPEMETIQGKDGGLYVYDKRRPGQPVRVGSMPTDRFEDVTDANGQVIGQRNIINNKTERYTPTDTSDIREYNYAADQARKNGQQPEDFTTWMRANRKSGATTVDASTKAETEESKVRGGGIAKRLNEVAESGAKAAEDDLTLQRLGQLAANVKTGGRTNVLEGIRQMTGGLVKLDPKADDVQALVAGINYLAPRLRVPGSGSQSDRELNNFLISIPSLAGSPEGNARIMQTLQGIVEHRRQAAEIASSYQVGDIGAKEATKQISELASPFLEPPPAAAAEALKADPSLREQFDQRYGRGASNRVLGRR